MKNTTKLPTPSYNQKPASEPVRWHVIAIGILLLLVNTYWILMASEVWHSTQLTIASLFFNTVFTLLMLVVIARDVEARSTRLICVRFLLANNFCMHSRSKNRS